MNTANIKNTIAVTSLMAGSHSKVLFDIRITFFVFSITNTIKKLGMHIAVT